MVPSTLMGVASFGGPIGQERPPRSFDTIIVGGGSAGAVVAQRLSAMAERRVLLIEAGPDVASADSAPAELVKAWGPEAFPSQSVLHWGLLARRGPEAADKFPVPRGRVIGGTGAINAAIFLQALEDDFRQWSTLGLDRWGEIDEIRRVQRSLVHDSVVPVECRVPVTCVPENERRREQTAFVEACLRRELVGAYVRRLDESDLDAVGGLPLNFASLDGAPPRIRWNPAWSFLGPAVRARSNLSIRCNAEVSHVLWSGRRAIGVAGRDSEGAWTVHASEVILAAGAFHSPAILMRSGIGDPSHLRAVGIKPLTALPGVGKNLRDHPAVVLECPAHHPLVDGPANQVALRLTSPGFRHRSDLMVYPASRPHLQQVVFRPTLNYAESAGSVRLIGPAGGAVEITFDYLTRGSDAERLAYAVRATAEATATVEMAESVDASPVQEVASFAPAVMLAWLRENVRTGHHPFGTCAMGADGDPDAVVDEEGRVRGVECLRVVDASILPRFVRANINATVMTVAARIADWLTR